jgi:RNA polymerase sigma-70 factor (ECF subfamily)
VPLKAALARAQAGDLDAFEMVYRVTVGQVFAFSLRWEGSRGRAEDLVQDIFVRVWRALPSFRGQSTLATWIHAIAVRTAIDRARAQRPAQHHELQFESRILDELAGVWTPPNLDVERAIASLPDRMRQMFVLHAIEGHSMRDIAELTGVAVGTAQSQVFRAREKLRVILGATVHEPVER